MAQTVIEAETETEPEAETEAVAEPVHRGGGRFRETAKTSPAANRQATPRVQGEESGVMGRQPTVTEGKFQCKLALGTSVH